MLQAVFNTKSLTEAQKERYKPPYAYNFDLELLNNACNMRRQSDKIDFVQHSVFAEVWVLFTKLWTKNFIQL